VAVKDDIFWRQLLLRITCILDSLALYSKWLNFWKDEKYMVVLRLITWPKSTDLRTAQAAGCLKLPSRLFEVSQFQELSLKSG
jgi:hypothetical protein